MASVKVWKEFALEVGIKEEVWDAGVNKSVDKYYGSKYDEKLTEGCHRSIILTYPGVKAVFFHKIAFFSPGFK